MVFNDLGLIKELEDPDFRNQYFRAEREIDIPSQLKNLRKLRDMKQAELAVLAGTKQSAISRIERSQEQKWELETLVKLSEALSARLSVVIEPYEAVIARYSSEHMTPGLSAASAKIRTGQQGIPQSATNAPSSAGQKDKSDKNEFGIDRRQSGSIFDAGKPPARSSLSA